MTDGRSARREASRSAIRHAAVELFADQGYTGTSMDQVAERAGVSKGTIFYNFGSKAEMFAQIVEQESGEMAGRVADAVAGRHGWAALEAATLAIITAVDAQPAPVQILLTELFRRDRPWADTLARARETLLTPLMAILREVAVERRDAGLTDRPPGREITESIAASVFGALAVAALDRSAYAADRSIADIHAGLLLAISGLSASGQH
ncbi:TetR/AcrR family transcriptional regulator [Nigerium massiliense]|uniref:TetR/AcrR family transcriptional regulator n=1 Tax=Nigerium massiliense TaxID=1522317 RepID=UPI00058C3D11|nr:TetR/AcrR family transcriptional regulator [Nigerium massiliense]